MASMQPELGLMLYAWSDFPHPIQFCFPKKALIILCKTDLDLIWMAQQGFGQTLVSRNHWAHFLAGYNWLAASFPLSDLVVFFHRCPRSWCAKWAQIQFGSGRLCQILAKGIWSISKPVCKNRPACFWPMFLSQSRSDVNQIWHIYWLLVLSLQFSVPTPSVQFAVPALPVELFKLLAFCKILNPCMYVTNGMASDKSCFFSVNSWAILQQMSLK